MKSKPLISVVVPVYEVEDYLLVCVNSILTQTYDNLEIILVDDGSPDSSGKMCDELARQNNRIKTIHKQNEGLNMARKTGFDNSDGEWIIFVDSDDALHPQAIEILFNAASCAKTDFVIGGYQRFSSDSQLKINHKIQEPEAIHEKDTDKAIHWLIRDSPYQNVFMQTAWMKLYTRQLLNTVDWDYSNYRANEDEFMAIQYYPRLTNGVVIVPENLYYYRINEKSITRKIFKNEFQGKMLNKFETIETLYQKSLERLGKKFEKDILLRFTVQFLGFTEQYMADGNLDNSILIDYENYFKPKIKRIDNNKDELSEWHKSRFIAAKENGVFGLFGARNEELTSRINHLENSLRERELETEGLRSRIKYLNSPRGMIRTPLGKIKRLSRRLLGAIIPSRTR